MADWNESEHPRDGIGQFREKVARESWVEAIVGRLGGVAWPEARPFSELIDTYGDNQDDDHLLRIEGVGDLNWYAMPEQEVAVIGIHPGGRSDLFAHVMDSSPRGLRNTARLLFWAPDLDELDQFEEEDGVDPDGMVMRASLPSGETVGLLPDGTVRWLLPGGHRPPVDLTKSGAYELARGLNDAADRTEREIDDYQESLEGDDGEIIAEFDL